MGGVPILNGPPDREDAQDLTTAAVRGPNIAPEAVSELTIRDEAVTTEKLRDGAVTSPKIGDDAVEATHIRDGAVEVAAFASGMRPVRVVAALPELPYTDYIEGDLVFLTSDAKVYRLVDDAAAGSAGWSKEVDGADILANSITAGQIAAGAIATDELAADAVTADKIEADAVGADQLAALFIDVAKYIRSSNYVAGTSGWAIDGDGVAEFLNVLIRGTLDGSIIDGGSILGAAISIAPETALDSSTDFSATAAGADPTGWVIQSAADAQVVDDAGATGGKRFEISRQADGSQNTAEWTDAGDYTNAEIVIKVQFDDSPQWLISGPSVFLRYTSWADSYEMSLTETLAGAPAVVIIDGISTTLGTAELPHISAWEVDTDYYMKFRVLGSTLAAKVWKASETEPSAWSLSVEDNARLSGGVAVAPGSDGISVQPLTISVDTVEVTNLGGAFNVDPDGTFYMGASDSATAPFRVDPDGYSSAFVPVGGIILWSGAVVDIPSGWALCDGTLGTPDLRGRFVAGAGGAYAVGDTGGADTVTLTTSEMPAHNHSSPTGSGGSHDHGGDTNTTGSTHTHNLPIEYSATTTTGGTGQRVTDIDNQTGGGGTNGTATVNTTGSTHTHGITSHSGHTHAISSQGGDGAHENRPPYYALAYIMRTA